MGYPPYGGGSASIVPSIAWDKTKGEIVTQKKIDEDGEDFQIEARTAVLIRYSDWQEVYDVPFTSLIEIKGTVVFGFRKQIPFLSSHNRTQALEENSYEDAIIAKLEKQYPYFPDLKKSTLKNIERELEKRTGHPQLRQPIGLPNSGTASLTDHPHNFVSRFKEKFYKIEVFKIEDVIKEYFDKVNTDHSDKDKYRVENDTVIFKGKGVLKVNDRHPSAAIIRSYNVKEYPLEKYPSDDLEKLARDSLLKRKRLTK